MKRRFVFQKDKFLRLSVVQQHKKCAEFLQAILQGKKELLDHYKELISWMHLPEPLYDDKSLSDQLFKHKTACNMASPESSHIHVTHLDKHEAEPHLPICIYLDGLRSMHNIGSIIRTTEAMRLGSLYFSPNMTVPDPSQLQKSAMGTQNWVSYERAESLAKLPKPLIVLETITESTPYYDFTFPDVFTLAVGNEEYGCSDELLAKADAYIHIPLFGRKNSLNVAVAFAIVAAEIRRKHTTTRRRYDNSKL